jgi:hypothetical protein
MDGVAVSELDAVMEAEAVCGGRGERGRRSRAWHEVIRNAAKFRPVQRC